MWGKRMLHPWTGGAFSQAAGPPATCAPQFGGLLPCRLIKAEAMPAAVVRDLWRLPTLQEGLVNGINLDAERPANFQGIARVGPPQRHRQVAARAGPQRTQEVDLGEALQMRPLLRPTGPHQI